MQMLAPGAGAGALARQTSCGTLAASWVNRECCEMYRQPNQNWLTVLLIRHKMTEGLILSIKQMFLLGKNPWESSS